MKQIKLEFQEILAFIVILTMIFGANGFNLFKINQMVTRDEFKELKCEFIKDKKISAEKERKQLIILRDSSLNEPFQLQYIQDQLIQVDNFIDDKKQEYKGNKCVL